MSTKNDKTLQQLEQIRDDLLTKFTLEELQQFYANHSTRELEAYFKEHYGTTFYYGEKIFLKLLGFTKKTRESSKSYWEDHMKKTHEGKYGGVGFASPELAEKSYQTNLEHNGSRHFSNPSKAKQTRMERYGDSNYNNSVKAVQTAIERYGGVGYASPELCKKSRETTLRRYGDPHYSNIKQGVITSREHWGDDNYNNREQMHKTCFTRYGVRSYSQTKDFAYKRKKRYLYQGIHFDSSWELYLWIYCVDHSIPISFANVSFEYTYEEKTYKYFPDFKISNTLVEVKGDHFFEGDKMVNPYGRKYDGVYDAKFKCAKKNGVLIVKSSELDAVFTYMDTTYGKDYFRKFDIKQEVN